MRSYGFAINKGTDVRVTNKRVNAIIRQIKDTCIEVTDADEAICVLEQIIDKSSELQKRIIDLKDQELNELA